MRTLKYAILGLLCRRPHTGYDIAKAFENALGNFWYAKHSQIYPELKRLAEEGLVRYEVVIQGERMEKKLYSVTEEGRLDFHGWILRDEPLAPTPKDVFKLRVFLSDNINTDELSEHFRCQRKQREDKLAWLNAYLKREFGAAEKGIETLDATARGDYMVLTGGIYREQAYLDWIDHCLDILARVKPE